MEEKIDISVAEAEFERFAEAMDIDIETMNMDEDDQSQFDKIKRRVIRAIQKGSLIVNDNGEAEYTPQNGKSRRKDPLTFYERTGAALMAIDDKKRGHDVARMYAVMGNMCKVHPSVFAGLVGTDIKVCEALFAFLMD